MTQSTFLVFLAVPLAPSTPGAGLFITGRGVMSELQCALGVPKPVCVHPRDEVTEVSAGHGSACLRHVFVELLRAISSDVLGTECEPANVKGTAIRLTSSAINRRFGHESV